MEKYKDQFQSVEEMHAEDVDSEIGLQEEQSLKDSMRYDQKLSRELQKGKDQYYAKKQNKSKTSSSQLWNDED